MCKYTCGFRCTLTGGMCIWQPESSMYLFLCHTHLVCGVWCVLCVCVVCGMCMQVPEGTSGLVICCPPSFVVALSQDFSVCSSGCPRTPVDQVSLELRDLPASAFPVLGLKAHITISQLVAFCLIFLRHSLLLNLKVPMSARLAGQ